MVLLKQNLDHMSHFEQQTGKWYFKYESGTCQVIKIAPPALDCDEWHYWHFAAPTAPQNQVSVCPCDSPALSGQLSPVQHHTPCRCGEILWQFSGRSINTNRFTHFLTAYLQDAVLSGNTTVSDVRWPLSHLSHRDQPGPSVRTRSWRMVYWPGYTLASLPAPPSHQWPQWPARWYWHGQC